MATRELFDKCNSYSLNYMDSQRFHPHYKIFFNKEKLLNLTAKLYDMITNWIPSNIALFPLPSTHFKKINSMDGFHCQNYLLSVVKNAVSNRTINKLPQDDE